MHQNFKPQKDPKFAEKKIENEKKNLVHYGMCGVVIGTRAKNCFNVKIFIQKKV